MPSTQPATAVANSEKNMIRPMSAAPRALSVSTGWPAATSAATFSAFSASGLSVSARWTKMRSLP